VKRRRQPSVAFVIAVLVASGCAVASDNTPRDIDPGVLAVIEQNQTNVGQAAAGSGRIYLLSPEVPGEPARLQSVARDIDDDVNAVMDALLAGPNTDEFDDRYRSGLPAGMRVLDITRRARGVVQLNVDDAITTLRGDDLILALAQIVYTLNEVSGTTGVTITVQGAASQWPAGNGELQSPTDPLTVFDYPGLEPTTQPAYPAVPSED
jgi:spore germination protein GerM